VLFIYIFYKCFFSFKFNEACHGNYSTVLQILYLYLLIQYFFLICGSYDTIISDAKQTETVVCHDLFKSFLVLAGLFNVIYTFVFVESYIHYKLDLAQVFFACSYTMMHIAVPRKFRSKSNGLVVYISTRFLPSPLEWNHY